jgi:hypothetical protein
MEQYAVNDEVNALLSVSVVPFSGQKAGQRLGAPDTFECIQLTVNFYRIRRGCIRNAVENRFFV